jgi:hypothetical protein
LRRGLRGQLCCAGGGSLVEGPKATSAVYRRNSVVINALQRLLILSCLLQLLLRLFSYAFLEPAFSCVLVSLGVSALEASAPLRSRQADDDAAKGNDVWRDTKGIIAVCEKWIFHGDTICFCMNSGIDSLAVVVRERRVDRSSSERR